jgi:hypothetical protein
VGMGQLVGTSVGEVKEYPPLEIAGATWSQSGTQFTTTVTGASYGNGDYVVNTDSHHPGFTGRWVFDKRREEAEGECLALNNKGTAFVTITLPTAISLHSYSIQNRNYTNQHPLTWKLYGSNDNGVTVTLIHEQNVSQSGTSANEVNTYVIDHTTPYRFYRWDSFTSNDVSSSVSFVSIAEIRLYESTPISTTFPSLSTLRTTLTQAVFADSTQLLALTGEVVPDENNATTTYKALATTNPNLTNDQVRNLIKANSLAAFDATDADFSTTITIPKVMDITGNVFDSSAVNYAHVYLYGTDGVNEKHDALSTQLVPAGDNLPHIQVTDVSDVTSGILTISGTVFSSVANIASVKAAVFDPSVDLETDTATVATFVGTNGTDLSITADQYAVGSFTDFAMNSYFSNIVNVDGNLFENSIGDLEMSLDMTNLQNNKIYDLTLNNKDAIVVNNTNGGLIVGNDVDGDYVEFDGTTSSTDGTYIQLDTTLLSVPDFTFDIVFKIKQNHYFSNNNVVYVATSATGANNLFCMRGDPNVGADSTKLRFSFGDTIQYNKAYQWVYPDVLYRHTWVYSNGQISLYVNGEQLGDTTTATFDGQPTHFEINGHSSVDATTGMGTLPMKVYGVNVFNKALDATELASLWDNNNNVSVTNTSTSTPLVDGDLYRVVVVAADDTQPTTNAGIGVSSTEIEALDNLSSVTMNVRSAVQSLDVDTTYNSILWNDTTSISNQGSFIIKNDTHNKRYIRSAGFGNFNAGPGSFTIAFVLSGVHANLENYITYQYPTHFNIHLFPPFETSQGTSRVQIFPFSEIHYMEAPLASNIKNSDYILLVMSFNKDQTDAINNPIMNVFIQAGNVGSTNTLHEANISLTNYNHAQADNSFKSTNQTDRTFVLGNNNSDVYDMIILQDKIEFDDSDSTFTQLKDYFKSYYID